MNLPGETICSECGLRTRQDEPVCATQWDLLLARDYEQAALFGRFHRMAVDAYCLQHAPYIESTKSLAAHLCGLCIAFENGNDAESLRRLQQWLSGDLKMAKPALPSFRGSVTICDVYGIDDPVEFGLSVEALGAIGVGGLSRLAAAGQGLAGVIELAAILAPLIPQLSPHGSSPLNLRQSAFRGSVHSQ